MMSFHLTRRAIFQTSVGDPPFATNSVNLGISLCLRKWLSLLMMRRRMPPWLLLVMMVLIAIHDHVSSLCATSDSHIFVDEWRTRILQLCRSSKIDAVGAWVCFSLTADNYKLTRGYFCGGVALAIVWEDEYDNFRRFCFRDDDVGPLQTYTLD